MSTGVVNFFGWELMVITDKNGMVWLDLAEICRKLGLDRHPQLDSMMGQADTMLVQLPGDDEPQHHPVITPGGAGAWLALMDWTQIPDPDPRDKVMLLQDRLGEILNQAFIGQMPTASGASGSPGPPTTAPTWSSSTP
jgi:hypothetical protein